MKTINEILNNYKEYETFLGDRFGKRFSNFLSIEEMKEIGIGLKEEYKKDWKPKEWNEKNIIEQLKEDITFGIEKAEDERGISSELMFEVVKSWLKVLEDKEVLVEFKNYGNYGLSSFYKARDKYCKED